MRTRGLAGLLSIVEFFGCKTIGSTTSRQSGGSAREALSVFIESDTAMRATTDMTASPICMLGAGYYRVISVTPDAYEISTPDTSGECGHTSGFVTSGDINASKKTLTVFDTSTGVYARASPLAQTTCKIYRGFYRSMYQIGEDSGYLRILLDWKFFEDDDYEGDCDFARASWAYIPKQGPGSSGITAAIGKHALTISREMTVFAPEQGSAKGCRIPLGEYVLAQPIQSSVSERKGPQKIELADDLRTTLEEFREEHEFAPVEIGCDSIGNWDFKSGFLNFGQLQAVQAFSLSGPVITTVNPDYEWPLQTWDDSLNQADSSWRGGLSSEWCECRSIGTNPHIGTDFSVEAAGGKDPGRWSVALTDGTVENIEYLAGCGWTVYFRDKDNVLWQYLHMQDPQKRRGNPLKVQDQLKKGDRIGHHWGVPAKSCGSGPHLHLERLTGKPGELETQRDCSSYRSSKRRGNRRARTPRTCHFDPFFPWR